MRSTTAMPTIASTSQRLMVAQRKRMISSFAFQQQQPSVSAASPIGRMTTNAITITTNVTQFCRQFQHHHHHHHHRRLRRFRHEAAWFSSQCDTKLSQDDNDDDNEDNEPLATRRSDANHQNTVGKLQEHHHHHHHHDIATPRIMSTEPPGRHKQQQQKEEEEEEQNWLYGPRDDSWFTGVPPHSCPGFIPDTTHNNNNGRKGTLTSLPLPQVSNHMVLVGDSATDNNGLLTKKQPQQQAQHQHSLHDYFDNTWTLYELLFSSLNGPTGFYQLAPHGLRHPQIFYYGHSAVLYMHKLAAAGLLTKDHHDLPRRPPRADYYEAIFEVGVDEMSWDDMAKNEMTWPTVWQVHQYRQYVYETVSHVIRRVVQQEQDQERQQINATDSSPLSENHALWALLMGMEHERIHFETSSVLIRELEPPHLVQTPENWPALHGGNATTGSSAAASKAPTQDKDYPANPMIPANQTTQTVTLGKPRTVPTFGWDNEYGTRTVEVPPFAASQFMVTNGEYWHFVNDPEHGYTQPTHWCEQGWAWRCHRQMKQPYFWKDDNNNSSNNTNQHRGYRLRTLFQEIDMPWDWPVDVNYYEAKAYCSWKSNQEKEQQSPYRLLTEAEHHILRGIDSTGSSSSSSSSSSIRGRLVLLTDRMAK
mmetsp:Transcript_16943/g.39058  ORF Transcript_16943/g.39058 Transcript_16943/m.39058 type:complete len:646 (+) Transcript_16943:171-2108(+)